MNDNLDKNLNLDETSEYIEREYLENPKTLKQEIFEFFRDLIFIIIIVLIIRTYIILPFQISWQSMYDSYYDREFIIVDRFSYNFLREPKRWDVIVFNTHIDGKEYFIKRIIWLPGEILKISSWSVFIKPVWGSGFVELDEKYLNETNYKATYVRWDSWEKIYKIPPNSYFVMWDNRNASTDSRTCFSSCEFSGKSNYIKREDIVWKVFLDLGYFNFRTFSYTNPDLWIDTKPRWLSSPSSYEYK